MSKKAIQPPKFLKADKWIFHMEYPFIVFHVVKQELKVYQVKDEAPDFLIERTLKLAQEWHHDNHVKTNYKL